MPQPAPSGASEPAGRQPLIFLVAGEESGDRLGAGLDAALFVPRTEGRVAFAGVGGKAMAAHGLREPLPA